MLDKIQSSFRITFVKVQLSEGLAFLNHGKTVIGFSVNFPQKNDVYFFPHFSFSGKKHRGQYKGTLSYGKCICIPRRMQLCSHRRKATRDAPNGKLGDETPLANFSTPIMPLDGKSAKKQ